MMAALDEPVDWPAEELVRSVRRERQERQARHRRVIEQSRARQRRMLRRLEQHTRASTGGRGRGTGFATGSGGRGAHGMAFYLSGRRVSTTKVVRPPEPVDFPRSTCRVGRPSKLPSTVRMLVENDGKVGMVYVLRSSGNKSFDRCALRYAREMRFRPATDREGNALDVWIHLRMMPAGELAHYSRPGHGAGAKRAKSKAM